MSWREPFAERRQGLTRRSRVLLLIGGMSILLFTLYSINPQHPYHTSVKYLPDLISNHKNQNDDNPYAIEPFLRNATSAVRCEWAEVDKKSKKFIRDKAAPAFPLLSAWLKPEAARYGPALEKIPKTLLEQFSLGGRVRFEDMYYNQAYLGGKALQSDWTVEDVDTYRSDVRQRKESFTYDNAPLYDALDHWGDIAVKGKHGLVIGSETPWLEAMLLEYGASTVSTLEFGEIKTSHPQLTSYTPQEFTLKFLQGKIPPFDFAFSYSSLEHDGLGRYGDVLNPSGDLQTMARMLSVVKPGGFMFLGVPCCEDALYWNAHRVYGPVRYSEMFAGWQILGSAPSDAMEGTRGKKGDWVFQPVWALQNRMGCKDGAPGVDIQSLGGAFP